MIVYYYNADVYYTITTGHIASSEDKEICYARVKVEAIKSLGGVLEHLAYETFEAVSDKKEELMEIDNREEPHSQKMGEAVFNIIREEISKKLNEWLDNLITNQP